MLRQALLLTLLPTLALADVTRQSPVDLAASRRGWHRRGLERFGVDQDAGQQRRCLALVDPGVVGATLNHHVEGPEF